MAETTPGARPRSRAPIGLLGMLVLVGAVEGWVGRRERACFLNECAESWAFAGRAARRESAGRDVLFFGDSLVKFGVSPRVFEERTGLTAYNLAAYGGSPAASVVILERALAAGARPRAIVVDYAPHLLVNGDAAMLRFWQSLATPAEAAGVAASNRDAGMLARLMLGVSLPTVRARDEVRKSVVMAMDGTHSYTWVVESFFHVWMRNWHANRGGETRARDKTFRDDTNLADTALYPVDPWWPEPVSAARVEQFLAIAADRSIPVYWLIPPIHPTTYAERRRRGLDATYTDYVRSVAARHPALTVVDARSSGYPSGVFYDSVHLIAPGTTALTATLAEVVARPRPRPGPAGARWVDLPAYRETPTMVALEDDDQSRARLRAAVPNTWLR